MSTKYTMAEIAEDYDLWGEYVDPSANMTEDEFGALSIEEKVAMQREMFPGEAAEEDANQPMTAAQAIAILAGQAQGDRDDAIQELSAAVEAESEYGDPDSSLVDWISAGDYTGSETVESIAAEWDERDE